LWDRELLPGKHAAAKKYYWGSLDDLNKDDVDDVLA
jgi:hypothetical protein